jgi:two-component system chemotaxis response regulator CheY
MVAAAAVGRRQAEHVLVIENDAAVREAIVAALKRAGYRTVETNGGEQAAVHLGTDGSAHAVQAILCDIRTPRIKGVEATMYFRARYPDIPVIVTADYADIEWAITLMKRGAADYLVKPVSKEDLLMVMKSAIRRKTTVSRVRSGMD